MPGPGDLQIACEELLTASAEALDTIPDYEPTLLGAPERQMIAFGGPALDCCDQLAVNVAQVLAAPTAPGGLSVGRRIAAQIWHVFLSVTISRCYPSGDDRGNPPSAAEQTAASAQLDADGWALWNHLYNLWTSEQLFTVCDEVFWDSLRPIGPSGGCAGWVLGLHISLDGYNEFPST